MLSFLKARYTDACQVAMTIKEATSPKQADHSRGGD
jgi:hypothetical protein